jgi:hypothetical protein
MDSSVWPKDEIWFLLVCHHTVCYRKNTRTPWRWCCFSEWIHTSLKVLLKRRAVYFTCLLLLLFFTHDRILSKLDRKFLDIRRWFWGFSLYYKEQVRAFLLKTRLFSFYFKTSTCAVINIKYLNNMHCHWILHNNKCTNCISYISLKLYTLKHFLCSYIFR